MVKKLTLFIIALLFCSTFFLNTYSNVSAQNNLNSSIKIEVTPQPCRAGGGCPTDLIPIYAQKNEACATSLDQFKQFPTTRHYWIEDPEITAQGKANERARQFVYWAMNRSAIDDAKVLKDIWNITRNIAYFFTLFIAALFGIGFIVSKKTNFQANIKVWPTIVKIVLMLLYISFSASIVLLLIQLSEVFMKFFVENLGGSQLFNIYFKGISQEANYTEFIGCRDLNLRVQEGVQTELFLLRLTNITYYVMGVMLILRKILLWFLLFVAPFLALLMPFVFIRNIGWIWIGVFFQWLCYGPLFALFLGALSRIWAAGIPFAFDFSRVKQLDGYIYPTGINILYGGPGQVGVRSLNGVNNGNYIDTFAEYIITLIMLWAAVFFPWWLLRIFRDYCCDGIYAMKNILLAMYDQSRGNPPKGPQNPPAPTLPSLKLDRPKDTSTETDVKVTVKMKTMEEIRKVKTEDISKSMSLKVTKLSDIARIETNKQQSEMVKKNLNLLSNPIKAQTPAERQQFMNMRTELFSRAVKNDSIAKNMLSSTTTSRIEQLKQREEFLKTTPHFESLSKSISQQNNISEDTMSSITTNYMHSLSKQGNITKTISELAKIPQQQVQSVLSAYSQNISKPINQIVKIVATKTDVTEAKVKQVIKLSGMMSQHSNIIRDVTNREQIKTQELAQTLRSLATSTTQDAAAAHATPQPVTKLISSQANISEEKAQSVTETVMKSVAANEEVMKSLQQQTGLQEQQVKNVITTYAQNVTQAPDVIADRINQTSGVEVAKVNTVIKVVSENIANSKDVVEDVAQKTGVKAEEIENVIQAQVPLAAEPEQHVEQTIAIPPSVSIEDYEEVKEMWEKQYEEGDVPVSDNVQSRDEWVEQDIVIITNTLNKLISTDDNLRQEGLEEIGFILPIFTINNLKGEELLVYLKAKLTAAKAVKKDLEKEKKLRAKFEKEKEDDEENMEFVEIKKPKEAEKPMEMEMELDEENGGEKKEKNIEDLGKEFDEEEKSEEMPEYKEPQEKELGYDEYEDDPLAKIRSKLDKRGSEEE